MPSQMPSPIELRIKASLHQYPSRPGSASREHNSATGQRSYRRADEPGSASSRNTAGTSAVATSRTGTQTASDDWQTQDAVSPRSGTSLAVLQALARTRTPPLLRWIIQAAKSRGRGLMLATYARNRRRPEDGKLVEKAPDERAIPWPTRIGGEDTRRSWFDWRSPSGLVCYVCVGCHYTLDPSDRWCGKCGYWSWGSYERVSF